MSNEPNALTNVVVSESNMETPVLVNDFATQELPAEKNLPVENISALTSANVLHAEIEPIKLDNLPLHQKHIMKRLEGIRESKQRILSALHKLKESATDEKMIRENASEDIQLENEANEKSNDTININGSNIEVKNTDMATNRAPNEEVENDVQELNEELSKLGTVTSKAVAASIMNDKLLEAFQLHHQKKAALEELQRRNKETQKGVENQTLQEVQMARLKGK
ncbi:unnamed protein product [Thelazia callipaeda]|uniref:Coiled-coil domain-containing protein n=1 Tax=Thelazia callipaeda TaxID=103827 RepID=A0A0N5CSH5_THECL|nr:unnamed protein product [Thelazia callipaeda]